MFPGTRLREYGSETLDHPLQDNDDLVLSASNNKPRSRSIASIRYETYGEVYGGCGATNNCKLIPVVMYIYIAFVLSISCYVLSCSNVLLMCKSPDILHHSRSCFLTTPNLYVQIPELGARRLSRQRKTRSISRSSRSSCSEARVRHRSIFFRHRSNPPSEQIFGAAVFLSADLFVLPQHLPEVSA
jgi:hypothetical protein